MVVSREKKKKKDRYQKNFNRRTKMRLAKNEKRKEGHYL